MHITEVIIDGFKSYAIRTVISQWDASFNAITGLNGSGKSNILDAICFCLGIAKYDLLRASGGVQDLIYKRGQAGVTKASVTIVFDNNDIDESGKKRLCPVGFEDYSTISVTRQVVLGGTSKYLINGHRAQQQTVQNLFQSVQLNINNPNFLIMQGRVTKVLNMKSTEILGMVEEAAGTRMFEDRREKALRTMAKKQAKVEELEHLLKEEIDPKLERLRGEKRAFLEFQSTQNDLERLTKLVVAYEYVKSREKLRSSKADADAKEERVAQLNENAERLRRELSVLEEDMNRVRNVRENELRKGGRYSSLEEKVKAHSHGMVRLTTVIDLKRAAIQEEDVRLEKASNTSKTLGQQLQEKIDARKILQKKYDKAHTEFEERKAELDIKEELLQTLQTGISSSASSDGGYAGQLTRARDSAAKAGTEIEQSRLKISHLKNRIAEDEPRARQAERDNALLLEGVDTLRAEVAALDSQLLQSGCDPVTVEQQQGEKASTSARVSALRSEIETLSRRTTGLDFSYSDPYPEFDRRKVKGLVAQLFNLPTTATEASTALEICAGGRLYNVVVDSASTGAELLQGGKLRRRVTIVPLDKISAHRASTEQVTAAQKCAPGKVHLAVTLIGYEHEVHKAMEYVFGNTLIAADATTAKKVTFDPAVRLKSVTLEGDVYDPSGTLSGGSTTQSSGILLILRKIGVLRDELGEEERKLSNLEQTMRDNAVKIRSAAQVKQRLELKTHEIILAERQIASNSGSSVIAQVQEMRDTVESLEELIHEAQTRKQDADAEARRIEKEMKDFSSNKTAKLDQLMKESDKLKAVLLKSGHDLRPLQQELREADLDVEQVGIDLATAHEELQDAQGTLIAQQQELESLVQENDKVKFEHDEAIAELEDERRKLGCFDEEISDLEGAAKAKAQQLSDEKLEVQQLGHALETLKKAQMGNSQALKAIQKEHDWVLDDEASFGRAGTPYCFDGQDMKARNVELSLVQERAQGMRRKINPAVMATIDSVEKKERDLKTMMKTVIRDKRKIEETISSLDEYKKEALHKTWSKVNRDFGMIFNDLLPGNTAKLDPLEGKDISEGLEVKVCLGKVWKQSLTELSGGQRSLIALSLILSLLQYSPAPMYILDEVDAALDLSHTQNIGRLIRTRFTGSQFIVVSLKDGMFTNANRIFRTRFMDGTSVVQTLGPADVK